jgi:hypothetical protein
VDTAAAREILKGHPSVLLIDWPAAEVPDALVRAGYEVHVKAGPGPDDFGVRQLQDGAVVARRTGRRPDRVDVVYAHRPLAELPGVVQAAADLGARAVWYQSGLAAGGTKDPRGCWLPPEQSRLARAHVEARGLAYIDDCYIVDLVTNAPR